MSYSVWILSKGLYSCDEVRAETYNQSDRRISYYVITHIVMMTIPLWSCSAYPNAVGSVVHALRAAKPTVFLGVMGQTYTVIVTAVYRNGIVIEIVAAAVGFQQLVYVFFCIPVDTVRTVFYVNILIAD